MGPLDTSVAMAASNSCRTEHRSHSSLGLSWVQDFLSLEDGWGPRVSFPVGLKDPLFQDPNELGNLKAAPGIVGATEQRKHLGKNKGLSEVNLQLTNVIILGCLQREKERDERLLIDE